MSRALLALVLLSACTKRIDTTHELAAAASSSSSSSAELHQVVDRGPVDRQTVVVEEFSPPNEGEAGTPPAGESARPPATGSRARRPRPGALERRTTTTTEHIGPVVAHLDLASLAQAAAATSTHAEDRGTMATSWGPPPSFWWVLAALLGLVLVAIYLLRR